MKTETQYPFYFAIPRGASKASRERVPAHLFKEFGVELIAGSVEHVRSEGWFHLYRVLEVTR